MGEKQRTNISWIEGDTMGRRGMNPSQAAKLRTAKGLEITKLQKTRLKRGLSQSELATKSGVPLKTIQHYEQKKRQIENAKLYIICDLCSSLGCKIEDILEDEKMIERIKDIH